MSQNVKKKVEYVVRMECQIARDNPNHRYQKFVFGTKAEAMMKMEELMTGPGYNKYVTVEEMVTYSEVIAWFA